MRLNFVNFVLCSVVVLNVVSFMDCARPRGPRMRMAVTFRESQAETLSLPSNATSIREDITDNFSCENRTYGYYADVDNECQIFHVCLPVTYANGKNQTFRWSFICPEETVFDQQLFTCVRQEDLTLNCEDSADHYNLNDNFGGGDGNNETEEEEPQDMGGSQQSTPMGDNTMENNDNMGGDGVREEMMPSATPGTMEETRRKQSVNNSGGRRKQNQRRGGKKYY